MAQCSPPHNSTNLTTGMRRSIGKVIFLAMVACVAAMSGQAQQQTDDVKEEVEEIRGILEGLNESFIDTRNTVELLRKFKFSGYIQTQFRSTSENGAPAAFSGGDFPARSSSLFQVRRGRLKLVYDNILTQAVIQLDAIPGSVSVRDVYIWAVDPWMQSFGLQAGGFDRPFGYEISFSSGWRESPERSRLFQTLFPGERDVGVKLFFAPQLGSLSFLRAELGMFNGVGVGAPEYDDFKDLIGRAGVQIPFAEAGAAVDLGVSVFLGEVRNDTKYLWAHGERTPGRKGFVVDSSALNLGDGVPRRYVGVDVQAYYDVPVLGGLVVRAEVIGGTQPGISDAVTSTAGVLAPEGRNLRNVSPTAQATGPVYRRDVLGWYVNLVQNIGSRVQVLLKYDVLDPNTAIEGSEFTTGQGLSPADVRFATLGVGGLFHWDETIRLTLYHEFVRNEEVAAAAAGDRLLEPLTRDRKDDVFTARLQYRF